MRNEKEIVGIKKRTYYGDTAKEYDVKRMGNFYGKITDKLEKKAIQKLLNLINIRSILDLPCGTGRITEYLLKKKYEVSGVDVSQDMVKLANKKLSKFKNLQKLTVSGGENLPFKNNEFDCVICVRLMGHLPFSFRIKILKELNRVSKYIIISYHNTLSILGFFKYLKMKLGLKDKNWFQVEKKQAIKELKSSGFKVKEISNALIGIAETYFILGEKY